LEKGNLEKKDYDGQSKTGASKEWRDRKLGIERQTGKGGIGL